MTICFFWLLTIVTFIDISPRVESNQGMKYLIYYLKKNKDYNDVPGTTGYHSYQNVKLNMDSADDTVIFKTIRASQLETTHSSQPETAHSFQLGTTHLSQFESNEYLISDGKNQTVYSDILTDKGIDGEEGSGFIQSNAEKCTDGDLSGHYITGVSTPPRSDDCLGTRSCSKAEKSAKRQCLCHDDCVSYGNCCIDHCLAVGMLENQINEGSLWSCVEVRTNVGYYMISSCPQAWNDTYVKRQCESNQDDKRAGIHLIPVTSRDGYLTYRNVYCAICNRNLNVVFWNKIWHCKENISVEDMQDKNIDDCIISSSKPNLTEGRRHADEVSLNLCTPDLISECSMKWRNENKDKTDHTIDIIRKCALFYAPVQKYVSENERKKYEYKNKFCARCNHVENATCFAQSPHSPPSRTGMALTVIFDIDFFRGGKIVGTRKRCVEMQLYDLKLRACRHVICDEHYVLEGEKCVPTTEENNDVWYSSIQSKLPSNCSKIRLGSSQVEMFENGTIKVIGKNIFYNFEEYDAENNESFLVCSSTSPETTYTESFTEVERKLTIIGTCISLASLFVKICLSLFSKEKPNLPSKIVLFLSLSLFIAQFLFTFGVYAEDNFVLCAITGILTHYSFLAAFFWTNVLAFDIWKTFASSDSMTLIGQISPQFNWYNVYGWCCPLVIVTVSVFANLVFHHSQLQLAYGNGICWISDRIVLAAFFAAPVFVLILSNMVFFVLTAFKIRRSTEATRLAIRNKNRTKDRIRFILYCKLAFIMGVTWLLGFLTVVVDSLVIRCLFIVLNSIQGVYILLAFAHFDMMGCLKPRGWVLLSSNRSKSSVSSATTMSLLSKTGQSKTSKDIHKM